MIVLENISKRMGTRTLFDDVNTSFIPGHRYGLTGPNGAGKSTLLKIMMGVIEANSGRVILPKRVGFLRQNIEDFLEFKVLDTVIMGNERLWNALETRDRLYEEEMTDEIGMRLGSLEEVVAEEDGYSAEANAEILLIGMGIPIEFHTQVMNEIPTDLQFRVLLAQALFGKPEALLLDEPTNHLDISSIGWLEEFLFSYSGTLIVISHDRHFLNAVTTHIADIDYDTIISYPGNYDQMLVTKSSVRRRAEDENKAKEKKVENLKEFISKFSAGTRASQVKSRARELNRLQPQELKKSNIDRPYIRFYPPEKSSGKVVLKVENLSKSFDGKPVVQNFSYEVFRDDKIGVIGNNGRGKTTLLRMLAGVLQPDSGHIELGHNAELGYFPQNHSDVIDKEQSFQAFDWLRFQKQGVFDQDIRSVMGKMLLSGDDAFKQIKHLSGGETARLLFARMMLFNYNTLVMDEPNNHLDLESVSALSWALSEYKGTAVIAAHDRDLLSEVCTRIIAFEEDGIHTFDGPFEDYIASKQAKI